MKWGKTSLERIATCHPALRCWLKDFEEHFPDDAAVVCGWRGEKEQNEAFLRGNSRRRWPESKHNAIDLTGAPDSLAVDLVTYHHGAVDWSEECAIYLAGYGLAIWNLKTTIYGCCRAWNLEWSGNWKVPYELVHFELVPKKT